MTKTKCPPLSHLDELVNKRIRANKDAKLPTQPQALLIIGGSWLSLSRQSLFKSLDSS